MKYPILLCIIGIMVMINPSASQNGLTAVRGAKSASLGFTGATLTGPESIYHNPAGLVFSEHFSVLISSEQRFLLEDLNASSISAVRKWDNRSAIGLFIGSFGLDEFKEQKIALAYSRQLSESVSLGTHFDYIRFSIEEYGSKGAISFGLGIQTKFNQQLTLGFYVVNPVEIPITVHSNLENFIAMGLAYKPSDKITLYAELSKVLDREEQLHFGLDYLIIDRLSLRFGSRSSPALFSFGIGYRFSENFYMDGGFNQHQYLDFSPSLSLGYAK